jgi:hypothetical protein
MNVYSRLRRSARGALGALLVAATSLSPWNPARVSTAASPVPSPATTLELIVPPGPYALDTILTATLVAGDAQNLAGFQGTLRFDPAQLHFAGFTLADGLAQSGRTPLQMGPVRLDGAVVFGAATCPAAECNAAHPDQAQLQSQGVNGRIELAQVQFYVVGPGPQTLTLTDTQLVNPLGQRLDGDGSAETAASHPAWDPQLDVTGNQFVNDADAGSLIEVWMDWQRRGICLAPGLENRDFNQDGCLDVADVQTVLAAWGSTSPALAAALMGAEVTPASLLTLTVNSDLSEADLTPGDGVCLTASGVCTLPAAVEESNARPGRETITFNIRNQDGSCPSLVTIAPPSGTRISIDDPRGDGVTIDGYTQCNAKPNTSSTYSGNAVFKIELKGRRVTYDPDGSFHVGIEIQSPNNVIRGLSIYSFMRQIYIFNARASNNVIEGNQLGKNVAYSSAAFGEGLRIASPYNTVGGTSPQARNVIGGSNSDGINIEGQNANYNVIIGNYVGVRQDGKTSANSYADGIDIAEGAAYNRVGGPTAAERNVIASQGRDGIELSHQLGTAYNWIEGNYIGLAADGVTARGNGNHGITLEDLPNHTTVINNIIVANAYDGIGFFPNANYNQILNNWIGVLPDGTPMGNGTVVPGSVIYGRNGIYLLGGSQHNLIQGNVIAHNPQYGILLTKVESAGYGETHFNTFSQNSIYNNGDDGIQLDKYYEDGTYPNEHMLAPKILGANPLVVTGTSTLSNTAPCVGCKIEIFIADDTVTTLDPDGETAGEGRTFVGEGLTDGNGAFSVSVSGVSVGQKVTATATDTRGNTSEFAENVVSVNDAPTISDIGNQVTAEDTPTGAIAFVVGDVETPAGDLTVTGTSSNPTLVPDANIVFGGSGANRTVTITPAANQWGTTDITIVVDDGTGGTASDTFVLTVTAVNDAPTISDIGNQVTAEDTPTGAIAFVVGDVETPAGGLTVTGTSSNPTLVPDANIVFGGSGANRTVTITPAANQWGTTDITIVVDDGTGGTASDIFLLVVTQIPVTGGTFLYLPMVMRP